MSAEREWFSPEELSEWLGIALKTLKNWRQENKGPAYTKVGRLVRYRRSEVEKWLKARHVERAS